MAPIFKTSSGLPLAVYIEPSSNRAGLLKTILSNGGGVSSRIPSAHVILVNVQSRDGRECARQLCTDPDRVVLFHEWVDACLTSGKLLGDELNWGNLRIQDPEIVDENLYAEDTAPSAPKVKEEAVDGTSAESNRPWPTPTSPTQLPEGELPVSAGLPSRTAPTPPLVKSEATGQIPESSQQEPAHQPSFVPERSKSSSPPLAKSTTPPPSYGNIPHNPELNSLFHSACKEWNAMKKAAESYVSPVLKRKSYSMDRNIPTQDKPPAKSPRLAMSQDQTEWSPTSTQVYEPLAKKQRPPLPAGSTKRGPKRRNPVEDTPGDRSGSSSVGATPSQSLEDATNLGRESSLTPRSVEKLFTFFGEPIQFWLQMDLPDRGAVIRLLKKHGGQIASTLEAASYVIVSKAAPQYVELLVEADAADRVAVPVAWIHQCVQTNKLVPVDDYAIISHGSKIGGPLAEEDIIRAATADTPPAPSLEWIPAHTNGYKFTADDQAYLQRYLAWKVARDPGFSVKEICQELGKNSPNHSYASWLSYYYRAPLEVSRVLAIVRSLRA